jgi:FkbM family methyltransferase
LTGHTFQRFSTSLYLQNAKRALKSFLRYPSATLRLIDGVETATKYVDGLIIEEFVEKPIKVKKVHGVQIYLNSEDRYTSPLIAILGDYEPEVTKQFERILKPRMTVMDVGANVGWFTLLSAKLVGEDGLVVALEPDPQNFSLLSKSVETNRLKNVTLLKEAASDADGVALLGLSKNGNTGAHAITRAVDGDAISVSSSKLDTVARRLGVRRIDLVKIDVEGHEPQVMSGMLSLINQRLVENIIMEWNPSEWMQRPELLRMIFESFDVYRINHLDLRRLTRLIEPPLGSSQSNLLLVQK